MLPSFGPVELILILVIVTMLFGVGKLPEVFGSIGRGIREFRRNSADPELDRAREESQVETAPPAPSQASAPTVEKTTAETNHGS